MTGTQKIENKKVFLAVVGILAMAAIVLHLMGQPWWCKCGRLNPWTSDAWSSHNSQHLFDPYSFTHFSHGLFFYWILFGLFRGWSLERRLLAAVSLESLWEFFENSSFVIERYRTATVSLDYHGDSVMNSVGDILSCTLGFLFASQFAIGVSLAVFAMLEVGLLLTIRDNLTLNIYNLLGNHPRLVQWQSAVVKK